MFEQDVRKSCLGDVFRKEAVWKACLGDKLAGDLFSGHKGEGMLGGMNMFGGCVGRACLKVFFSIVCFDVFFGRCVWRTCFESGFGYLV